MPTKPPACAAGAGRRAAERRGGAGSIKNGESAGSSAYAPNHTLSSSLPATILGYKTAVHVFRLPCSSGAAAELEFMKRSGPCGVARSTPACRPPTNTTHRAAAAGQLPPPASQPASQVPLHPLNTFAGSSSSTLQSGGQGTVSLEHSSLTATKHIPHSDQAAASSEVQAVSCSCGCAQAESKPACMMNSACNCLHVPELAVHSKKPCPACPGTAWACGPPHSSPPICVCFLLQLSPPPLGNISPGLAW